jgi:hypothetical protein
MVEEMCLFDGELVAQYDPAAPYVLEIRRKDRTQARISFEDAIDKISWRQGGKWGPELVVEVVEHEKGAFIATWSPHQGEWVVNYEEDAVPSTVVM